MKPAVLCITRQALPVHIPQSNAFGIYDIDLKTISEDQFHFINRDVVDSLTTDRLNIGQALPQILGYTVIQCGDEVLSYSRKKGAEARLHGSRSIGFGGHVDLTDYTQTAGYIGALIQACKRELLEELGLTVHIQDQQFTSLIVDQRNPVGSVHLGLALHIELEQKAQVCIDEHEISDPVWKNLNQLKHEAEEYENWSKLIIEQMA